MNEIIGYFLKTMVSSSYSLKKKSILVDKPWALIDNDGEIQKLIFKKNNELILSKNGIVTEGSWEYFAEARALLINRSVDKLLLKEQFIDGNVLILKKDGTDNEFFSLANENTIPDYNIPKYLNSLKCKKLEIKEQKLLNGKLVQIHGGANVDTIGAYQGKPIEILDSEYNSCEIVDDRYLSENKKFTFYIKNNKVADVQENVVITFSDGQTAEIENGSQMYRYGNISKRITINGKEIPDRRLTDNDSYIYEIKESKILRILFVKEYQLKTGEHIKIEQQDINAISKGDAVYYNTNNHVPNGSYKLKGKLLKIKIKDGAIA